MSFIVLRVHTSKFSLSIVWCKVYVCVTDCFDRLVLKCPIIQAERNML